MANESGVSVAPQKLSNFILQKRLRLASILICLGLLVLLLTLIRIHPLSFIGFIVIACPLALAGILLFLYSIVSHSPQTKLH